MCASLRVWLTGEVNQSRGGVSPGADLSFSSSELKCAITTRLDAAMRESRDLRSGVDIMQAQIREWLRQAMKRVLNGQGLVEYALLLVLLSIASIAILSALGTNIGVLYSASNVMVGIP